MVQMIGAPNSWKGAKSLEQARQLIDYGVLLRWRDMRTLRRSLSPSDEEQIVRHFAQRLLERGSNRLQAEILVESAMIWLANAAEEKLLHAFLEEIVNHPARFEACWSLVEISLTSEVAENAHDNDIFEMSVVLICELGISVQEFERAYPGEFVKAQALLDHIATYLLSVSNANSTCIRLSLLHYFGVTEHLNIQKNYFSRIMGRFGHTALDHLFTLLFRKRSEAVALQFLLENLPYMLNGDRHSQKIVHETFKYYMLKEPERFCLFIQAFASSLQELDQSFDDSRKLFLQHLGAMLQVANEVNHKQLGREFLATMMKFNDLPLFNELLNSIAQNPEIKKPFKDMLEQMRKDTGNGAPLQLRSSKRGRKPSFSRAEGMGIIHQVTYLGAVEMQKAS